MTPRLRNELESEIRMLSTKKEGNCGVYCVIIVFLGILRRAVLEVFSRIFMDRSHYLIEEAHSLS